MILVLISDGSDGVVSGDGDEVVSDGRFSHDGNEVGGDDDGERVSAR